MASQYMRNQQHTNSVSTGGGFLKTKVKGEQQLNSILLSQFTDTLNIYPTPVYQMLMLTGLLSWRAICQPSKITTGTIALMEDDNWLGLLPLPLWSTNVAWAIMWVSWLLRGRFFCHLPLHPTTNFIHPFCKLY